MEVYFDNSSTTKISEEVINEVVTGMRDYFFYKDFQFGGNLLFGFFITSLGSKIFKLSSFISFKMGSS